MIVDVIGTSCTWFKRKNTSFVLDKKFVLDVPEGAYKDILNVVDNIYNVDTVLISHLHTDHALDLHIFTTRFMREKHELQKPLKVYCPKTTFDRILGLHKLFFSAADECSKEAYDGRVEFIDLSDGLEFELGDYKVKVYEMTHTNKLECFGFTFTDKSGVTIGFSADTAVCDNLNKLVEASDYAFVEMAAEKKHPAHICIEEFEELQRKYPNVKMFPVHTSDRCQQYAVEHGMNFLQDGQVLEFNQEGEK